MRFAKCPRSERKSRPPKAEEVFGLLHGCLEQRGVDCRFGPSKALVLLCRHSATKALSASLVEREPLKAEGNVRETQVKVRSAAAAGSATEVPTPAKQHKTLPLDSPG